MGRRAGQGSTAALLAPVALLAAGWATIGTRCRLATQSGEIPSGRGYCSGERRAGKGRVGARSLTLTCHRLPCLLPACLPCLPDLPACLPPACRRMAPFVPQWYAALGTQESRYILYKVGVSVSQTD